jgi:hypothetical protein
MNICIIIEADQRYLNGRCKGKKEGKEGGEGAEGANQVNHHPP